MGMRLRTECIRSEGPDIQIITKACCTCPACTSRVRLTLRSSTTCARGVKAPKAKDYSVERNFGSGIGIGAGTDMRCHSTEQARNWCHVLPQYRVVVPNALGVYADSFREA